MLASQLPLDIILQIADLLLTKDKCSCSLTCKQWRDPFQKLLVKNIHVDSIKHLKTICNTNATSKTKSRSCGHLVHGLRIGGCFILPNVKQDVFFRSLPNLKHLNLGNMRFQDINTKMTQSNNTWMSLESLKIKINNNEGLQGAPDLIKFLKTSRVLEKLEIFTKDREVIITFTENDFENLHQNLQHLSSIKACISLNFCASASQNTIPEITPALALTTLYLRLDEWDPLFLYYFGFKYPNLHSLRLDFSISNYMCVDSGTLQRITPLFDSNPKALKYLETFELITRDASESAHMDIWQFFTSTKVPIKNFKYKTVYGDSASRDYKVLIERILRAFPKTLETLSILGRASCGSRSTKMLEISLCPLLVDLEINECSVCVDLNNLLDSCIALRQLKLHSDKLSITSGTDNREPKQYQGRQQHGLHVLELHGVGTSTSVFNCLSFRCRDLEYMKLCYVSIDGTISEETGRLLVDMPYTFFKMLLLCDVSYCSSDGHGNDKTIITIFLLSRLNNPLQSNEERRKDERELESTTVEYHNQHDIAWFHTFTDGVYDWDNDTGIVQLCKQQVSTAVNFFQGFRSNRVPRASIFDSWGGYIEEGWDADLRNGYAEFRCGNVEKYSIYGVISDDQDNWDKLHSGFP
ncbi:hypothetical protein F4703DRAFT_1854570 [Phycomyces blakesleeanus]